MRPPQRLPARPGATGRPVRAAAARSCAAGSTSCVANAPYVPTEAIALLPPEAREHEPRVALDGGADGLDVLRRVTAARRRWLAPGGHLLIETSERRRRGRGGHGRRARARVATCEEWDATVVVAQLRGARLGPVALTPDPRGR